MTDPVAWTRQQITRREEAARAAVEQAGEEWTAYFRQVVAPGGRFGEDAAEANSSEVAIHIALNDPAAVLRRCAADRKLLDGLLAQRHDVVDDCWYTCAAATEERDGGETCDDNRRGGPCDCGRDARIERYVRYLAEGYGWTEEA